MGTAIELDENLLEQVLQLGNFTSKKSAADTALAEYVNLLKRRQLLELRGKVAWQGDLEQLRSHRFTDAG